MNAGSDILNKPNVIFVLKIWHFQAKTRPEHLEDMVMVRNKATQTKVIGPCSIYDLSFFLETFPLSCSFLFSVFSYDEMHINNPTW